MLTYDECYDEIKNHINAQELARAAMFYEYRTTGELSTPRALEIMRAFHRRGVELEEAAGVRMFRELNGQVHFLHDLRVIGAEGLFGPGGRYASYESTPGYDAKREARKASS